MQDGQGGDGHRQPGVAGGNVGQGGIKDAQRENETGGFGPDRLERRAGRGRTLVEVRGPELQGERGDLERQPAQEQQEPKLKERVIAEIGASFPPGG